MMVDMRAGKLVVTRAVLKAVLSDAWTAGLMVVTMAAPMVVQKVEWTAAH